MNNSNIQRLLNADSDDEIFYLTSGYYSSADVKAAIADIYMRHKLDAVTKADNLLLVILEDHMKVPV